MKFNNKEITIQEGIETRENLLKEARELNDLAISEKRDLTSDEKSKFDNLMNDISALANLISAEKRENILNGFTNANPAMAESENRNSDKMNEFRAYLKGEKRDLFVDGDSNSAGDLAPQEFVKEIIKDVEANTPLISKVNTIHLNKVASIGVPYEADDASDAEWTSEIPNDVSADSSWKFGKRELGANQLIKLVKITKKLLKTSAFDVSTLVADKLSYKTRVALEKGILTGNGNGQPLGVFTASDKDISTARDISTGSAEITGDDIIKLKRSVNAAYRTNGIFVFHPDVLTKLYTLKDKNGQYIWRSGLTQNEPDTLDGTPVIESDFAPNEIVSGGYVGLYGDFSKYWLTMVDSISIQTLLEKYAESGEVGYLATLFADGQPVNEKAFSRLVMA